MTTTTRSEAPKTTARRKTIPRAPESAEPARRLVEAALRDWNLQEFTEDATLVVSELVANAAQHARGDMISVSIVLLDERTVRLAVVDKSDVPPQLRKAEADDVRGRGLPLIDVLSWRWGADRLPWGKRVWSELRDGER
ncbi:hypothetical protein OK074_1660 [Actinobacteria bacterium OK074]|nr:hypothetical protein OK074_1660 [Actinobacteria bacterium OK074]